MIWPWQDRTQEFSWLKALTLALMFGPAIWLIYHVEAGTFGRGTLGGMTYWSGLWATAMLLLALAVTPAAVIFRWRRLVILRRMIGVTALVYTIAHIIIYFALRYWDFAFIARETFTRLSLIVALVSTLGVIALGATSLDYAIRRMGAKNWNRLHNTVYVFTALAVAHYLLSPSTYPDQYLVTGVFVWLMAWRLLDRRGRGTDVTALAILAVACTLFTVLFEAAWTWFYYAFEPSWTLANNFNQIFGIPASWKVLVLGLLVALAARLRRAPDPAI